MDSPAARRRFADLVRRPQGAFRLAEGALLLAQEEYPRLDVEAYLQRLDTMADTIKQQLGLELDPRRIVHDINTHLFDELNFRGNEQDYYDPRNSFLNDVLERRIGIPITLSVLYLDIGRLVGLPVVGVGLPGHFIVQYAAQPHAFWIDPFHRGQVLTREDCVTRLRQIYGDTQPWQEAYLQPVSDHDILSRMLSNLKGIYLRQRDYRRALSTVERLILLRPDIPTEIRDRGLLYAQLGQFEAALDDLQLYLQRSPEGPDAPIISRNIAALRKRLQR